ncbi:MAG: YegP family protein [Caulobacterales bacterium]
MYYYVYLDVQGQWRWTLYAANNRKIANSGEGYFNKADCIHGLNLTADSAGVPIKYAA